jgi:phenylacetate-coenzyme A ligase PaaK-like adenylate-forming protein
MPGYDIGEAAKIEPILLASREVLQSLQLERLQSTLLHAYEHNPTYRREFDQAGVHPRDLRSLDDLASFPFTTKAHLRDAYPFGFIWIRWLVFTLRQARAVGRRSSATPARISRLGQI